MFVVGLTGGIGSGKSTVAAMMAELGAAVVDADVLAREVVAPGGPAHDAVLERFGTLDRARLADVVFADPEALADLNAIVHPAVRAAVTSRLDGLAARDGVVVLVVPLLVEAASPYPIDVLAVVDCPEDLAVERLVSGRAMDEADARRRLAAQAGRDERLAVADVVIRNDGTPAELAARVRVAWEQVAGLRRVQG